MPDRGKLLRHFRMSWGFSTRTVEAKSRILAEKWGDSAYIFNASHLTKIENGERSVLRLSMGKMVSAGEILSKGSLSLYNLCKPQRKVSLVEDPLGGPMFTQYVKEGRLAETFAALLASAFPGGAPHDMTQLMPLIDGSTAPISHPFQDKQRYVRAIVGQTDLCVFPMVFPGSFVIVDREFTRVPGDMEYENELQRPIFLVHLSEGYFCCFCDRVEGTDLIKIVQHPMGYLPHKRLLQPLKLHKEIEIVGAVVYTGSDRRPYLHSQLWRP